MKFLQTRTEKGALFLIEIRLLLILVVRSHVPLHNLKAFLISNLYNEIKIWKKN